MAAAACGGTGACCRGSRNVELNEMMKFMITCKLWRSFLLCGSLSVGVSCTDAIVAGMMATMPDNEKACIFRTDELVQNPSVASELVKICTVAINSDEASKFLRPSLYGTRGLAYSLLQDYDKALADFEITISLDPEGYPGYHHRGNIFVELERYKEALSDFNKSISLEPGRWHDYSNRALVHCRLEMLPKYKQDMLVLYRLNPDIISVEKALLMEAGYFKGVVNDIYDEDLAAALDKYYRAKCPDLL